MFNRLPSMPLTQLLDLGGDRRRQSVLDRGGLVLSQTSVQHSSQLAVAIDARAPQKPVVDRETISIVFVGQVPIGLRGMPSLDADVTWGGWFVLGKHDQLSSVARTLLSVVQRWSEEQGVMPLWTQIASHSVAVLP